MHGFNPGALQRALTQHQPPAQQWLYPTALCYKGLYRDVLLRGGSQMCCHGAAYFLKDLK